MSQAKVDQKKYIKAHRKEIERKKKMKFAIRCLLTAVIIGAIIGVPTGINIYRNMPKFVGDATLKNFVGNYIDENYADEVKLLNDSADAGEESSDDTTEAEAAEDVIEDALEESSDVEVEEVNEDNMDEVLDSSETDEDTEVSEDTSEE